MMVWGGLLYLKNGDLATVWRLSRLREELLAGTTPGVSPLCIRFLGEHPGVSAGYLLRLALYLYWFLGSCRRRRPTVESVFPEQELFRDGPAWTSLTYEEGQIVPSDACLVLHWILDGHSDTGWAFNYCRLCGGRFDTQERVWHLDLEDRLCDRHFSARARWVINASGIWADDVNASFHIETPYQHLFSKGVFLGLPRQPCHQCPLIFGDDNFVWLPWGPVALWGPTETIVSDRESALLPATEDVRLLLGTLNRYLHHSFTVSDVISLRCGVRPIAVRRGCNVNDSRTLSRRPRLWFDAKRPWVSVYGGNLTNATLIGQQVVNELQRCRLPLLSKQPQSPNREPVSPRSMVPQISFPGLPGTFPTPGWCMLHQDCWHLEDYLRRRTTIAQWVPRSGLGQHDEHRSLLERLAREISGDPESARREVDEYADRVTRHDSQVLVETHAKQRVNAPLPSLDSLRNP
jgi:glycerol-3-phosphate dehydrogenase